MAQRFKLTVVTVGQKRDPLRVDFSSLLEQHSSGNSFFRLRVAWAMEKAKPLEPEEYQTYIAEQKKRIRKITRDNRVRGFVVFFSSVVTVATGAIWALFILAVLLHISSLEEPTTVGDLIENMPPVWPELAPLVVFFFGPLIVFVIWRAVPHKKRDLVCPNCEHRINVGRKWVCGHCAESVDWGKHDELRRTALDPCRQCGKTPYAVACPFCGEDIVQNVEAYNAAPWQGVGTHGTNTDLVLLDGEPSTPR